MVYGAVSVKWHADVFEHPPPRLAFHRWIPSSQLAAGTRKSSSGTVKQNKYPTSEACTITTQTDHSDTWTHGNTTTILQPLYRSTCVSRHLQLRTGPCCWCKVLLPPSLHCLRTVSVSKVSPATPEIKPNHLIWHCVHTMHSRVYAMVWCLSVCLFIRLSVPFAHSLGCCGLLLWARQAANVDSVTLPAHVGSWRQTSLIWQQ